jgi:hypothetical protein
VEVTARDPFGNRATGFTGQVTVAIGTNPSGGTLSGTLQVNAVAGVATFSNLSINLAGTGYTLTASATGLTGATSNAFNVTAGTATQLAITTQPSSSVQSGQVFPQQPVVQLRDAQGNNVSQSGVSVTAAIASGGGTLGGTTPVNTNASGQAVFTDLSISGTVGDRTLSFSASGLTGATSNTITVTAGAATQLVITTQPSSSVQSGQVFPQQPVVQLRDASGNNVSQSGVSVTAAIASGGGALGGTTPVNTNAGGQAVFTDLSISGTVGDRTLSFSASGLTGATSNTINVTPGEPSGATSTISASPTSVAADGASASTITVQLVDASGNNLTTGGDAVVLATDLGTLSGVTDNGNGTYTATITSDTVGTATITGTVNGNAITDNATVEFTAP